MLECHIVLNLSAIKRLEVISDKVSSLLLTDPDVDPNKLLSSVAAVDRQSLFYWRFVAAAYCRTGELLAGELRKVMKTDWLQSRFLYPFAFSAINQPPDYLLPATLSYVLSGKETFWETALIQYAVGYTGDIVGNEAGFLLSSLLMHPYDALELLTDCLLENNAAGNEIKPDLFCFAERVCEKTGNRRLDAVLRRCRGASIKVKSEISHDDIRLELANETKDLLVNLVSFSPTDIEKKLPTIVESLIGIRKERYPNVVDFENVLSTIRAWRFTEAARMLKGYCAALFMFPRSDWPSEYKDFCALAEFFGSANAFIMTSPGLANFPWRSDIFENDWSEIDLFLDQSVREVTDYTDRCWIKALQYKVSILQREARVLSWVEAIEHYSKITRSYICGADWNWLEAILDKQKVHPFKGNLKAAYVFLLKDIEYGELHHEVVKSILRPIAEKSTLFDFLKVLMEAYGAKSTAFIFHFLTQENILRLSLAFSEIEALAGRISALTIAIQAFGFCEVVTEDIYEEELKYLTAAISYKRISASEFEVPWSSFCSEQLPSTKDLYDPIQHFSKREQSGVFILGEAKTENRVAFPNGVTVSYTLKNFQWATAYLIIEVIRNFMQHPGYGLEAILGTRIRHNIMVREFEESLDNLAEANIPGVLKRVANEIVWRCRDEIKILVADWVDIYLHSHRDSKPLGQFNVVPDQDEMASLIAALETHDDQRDLVAKIAQWLQSKLRNNLSSTRNCIQDVLLPTLMGSLAHLKESLKRNDANRSADIERVLAASSAEVTRAAERVTGWFEWPSEGDEPFLTLREVWNAVDGRFEKYLSQGAIKVRFPDEHVLNIRVARENVRMLFDIFSELYFNAIKYMDKQRTTLRISSSRMEGNDYLVISNKCNEQDGEFLNVIAGSMYQSLREHVTRIGETGLLRIAGSYATVARKNIEILSIKRNGYYHAVLPLFALRVNG
ncbi:hypothetical protein ACQZ45_26750 [Agrobacterium sp. 16-2014-1-2a]|jgi:hypothetical protein